MSTTTVASILEEWNDLEKEFTQLEVSINYKHRSIYSIVKYI